MIGFWWGFWLGFCFFFFYTGGCYIRVFIFPSGGRKGVSQITVSKEEILQRINLKNNKVRWRNICQHSHSSPKYLSLKERCEKQRGHRGRKTHKQGKRAVWKFVILKWPQYYASKNNSVLLLKERNNTRQKVRKIDGNSFVLLLLMCHLVL